MSYCWNRTFLSFLIRTKPIILGYTPLLWWIRYTPMFPSNILNPCPLKHPIFEVAHIFFSHSYMGIMSYLGQNGYSLGAGPGWIFGPLVAWFHIKIRSSCGSSSHPFIWENHSSYAHRYFIYLYFVYQYLHVIVV